MILQILAGTPTWVFAVFFVLLFYGYLQSKTREASIARVVMLPAIMFVLGIGGVLSSFAGQPASVLAWLIGFAAAVGLHRVVAVPSGVTFNPATRRFHLPGSWTPLALMMAIYFAKYTVGVTTAMQPDVAASAVFAVVLGAIFGILSGTFFGRFLRIWSARRDSAAGRISSPNNSQNWKPTA